MVGTSFRSFDSSELEDLVVDLLLDLVLLPQHPFHEMVSGTIIKRGASFMNWTFDWNEWFMLVSSVIAFSIVLLIRKHFSPLVFWVIWIYSIAYIETVDYSLAGSPFEVYYCADNKTYEPFASVIHIFLYPSFSFMFLFFYEKWKLYGRKLVWYILIWDVFSIFFEWVCIKNGVLTYTGWKLHYSIPIYPISALLLLAVYHFTKKQLVNPIPRG
jgi:hypothetical protein